MRNLNKEKIAVFIDAQNLDMSMRQNGWKLDYVKFIRYLKRKYNVCCVYYFIGYIPKYLDKYLLISSLGYTLVFKPVMYRRGLVKGNVDSDLIVFAMENFRNYSKAILVSSDGDFYPLLKYWIKKHKLLRLLTPSNRYSAILKE